MYHWNVSDVLSLLLIVVFIIGTALVLSVVTRCDSDIEQDRPNQIRAQLILLVAFVLGVLTLVSQRYDLASSVKHLMA